jgi:hypothetical protein
MSGVENINRKNYCDGMRDAIPIALGYLAVAFTLGIAARNAGVHVLPATIMSLTNTTSAGEFAAITAIAGGVGYAELALMQLVINLRYMLMSCALTQKLDPKFSIIHRFFIGFGVTDEIFGISVARKGKLNPCYMYGAMSIAIPGSPPINTNEPGTNPPPNTRFNSLLDVSMRVSSDVSTSCNRTGFCLVISSPAIIILGLVSLLIISST